MPRLTVTAKGQVTLRKEVLQHLGIAPGDQVEVDLSPGRSATLRPVARSGSLEEFFGALGPWTGPTATLEDIQKAIEDGWASAMDYEKDQKKTDRGKDGS